MNLSFCQSGGFLTGMNLREKDRILPFLRRRPWVVGVPGRPGLPHSRRVRRRQEIKPRRRMIPAPAGKSRNDPPVGYRETMLRTGGGRQGAAACYEGGAPVPPG